MKGADKASILEEKVILTSHDGAFSVEVNFVSSTLVQLHPFGVAKASSFAEVYSKIIFLFNEQLPEIKGSSCLIVIYLNNIKVQGKAGDFLNSIFRKKVLHPKRFDVSFVCSGFFSRFFWRIWLRKLMKFPYRISASEEQLSSLRLKKEEIKANNLKEELFTREIVHFQNETFYLTHNPEWNYQSVSGSFRYALVNKEVVLIEMKGELSREMIDESMRLGKEVVKGLPEQQLFTILALEDVKYPSWKLRRYAMVKAKERKKAWKHRIIITSPLMAVAYNTLKIAFPVYAENSLLVTDFQEGICEYLRLKQSTIQFETGEKEQKKKKKKKSKKKLEQRIQELERNQQLRIQELFHIFSKISWDEHYKPLHNDVDEQDPFYPLFYAVNFLQQDIFEIIGDQKELALTLEEKVKKRTEELYEKNRDLEKVNYELLKVNKELDHFVYSVSHDLRAPIASMKGLVNLLKLENKPENSKVYHMLISKNLDRLDSFIVEILELSRNSRLPVKKEIIKFSEIVKHVFEELEHLNNASHVVKKLDIKGTTDFFSDKHRVLVIFRNLLSNAIKYSMCGFKESYVNIDIQIGNDLASIRVEDNGTGIPQEHLPKIFEMFYRATDQNNGSGLGLYIVKEMVEKLNGSIEVYSEVGVGTSIILRIPNCSELSA